MQLGKSIILKLTRFLKKIQRNFGELVMYKYKTLVF